MHVSLSGFQRIWSLSQEHETGIDPGMDTPSQSSMCTYTVTFIHSILSHLSLFLEDGDGDNQVQGNQWKLTKPQGEHGKLHTYQDSIKEMLEIVMPTSASVS